MRALVPVAGVITLKTATEEVARIGERIEDLPDWNSGHDCCRDNESGVFDRLVEMRNERRRTYGVEQHLCRHDGRRGGVRAHSERVCGGVGR